MKFDSVKKEIYNEVELETVTLNNISYEKFDRQNAEFCIDKHMKIYAIDNDNLILCKTYEDLDKYKDTSFLCPSSEFEELTKRIFSLPFDDQDIDMNF